MVRVIDAIYAIAVTILALEIPGEFKNDFVVGSFAEMLVEYALSLLMLVTSVARARSDVASIAIRHSKFTVTIITVGVLVMSLLVPLENRYFLILIPLALMFERKLRAMIFR